MLKNFLRISLLILLIFSLVIQGFFVVADESMGVVYIHEGDNTVEITGLVAGETYVHNMMPVNVQKGKYFIGWYDEQGNATNTVTVGENAHLYAKYKDYLGDGVAVNYAGVTSKPALRGVSYIKDNLYETSVNEEGWAMSGWNSEIGGPMLGKSFTGSAYAWEPYEKKDKAQLKNKHNGYLISSENKPVGTVMELGWSACSNFILRYKDGYPIVPKPNTKYAVTITYEMIEEGNMELFLCGDRKLSQISNGANAVSYSAYSSCYSANNLNLKNIKAKEQRTHTFYITTSDFIDSVPMFSLHCRGNSFTAERVESAPGSDGKEYTSYTVGNTTYYPYKIVSTPHAVIKEVAINELEEGNVAITYNEYDENVGFSAIVVDGSPYTVAPNITNNSAIPNLWYLEEECRKLADTSVFPLSSVNYYSISYLAAKKDSIKNSNYYFDATQKTVEKDGQMVKAFNNLKTLRLGNASNGFTYKLSFSVMAEKMESDVTVEIATALPWNAATLKNVTGGEGLIIKKEQINADGKTWYDMEYYFTTDPLDTNADQKETGLDYHFSSGSAVALFMNIKNTCPDIYFTNIRITPFGDVIRTAGASVLNDEAEKQAGSQAIRYYFNYKTEDGSNIIIGNSTFKVIERGFVYRNGHLGSGEVEDKGFNAYDTKLKTAKNDNFNNCWSYDKATQTMTFSTYIHDLKISDMRKTEVKAYIVIEDAKGNRYVIHSPSVNRTIEGVKKGYVYDANNRVMVWNDEFDYYDSISQVNNFTQKYNTMVSRDSNLTTTTSEDNYFIDSETGELVLRVTSDGNRNYTTPKSVTTRDIMSYRYGYLEMRAKVPFRKGMWPSFWMQPDKSDWNKATYAGEIDIFEGWNETDFSCNLHKWYQKEDGTSTSTTIGSRGHFLFGGLKYKFSNTEIANEYHIYGFEWTPEFMAFYIDNELYCKIDITEKTGDYDKNVPGMDCFHKYYYICFNNWVFTDQQSSWHPDRAETLEDFAQDGVDYRIDYIRLYQNSGEELYIY